MPLNKTFKLFTVLFCVVCRSLLSTAQETPKNITVGYGIYDGFFLGFESPGINKPILHRLNLGAQSNFKFELFTLSAAYSVSLAPPKRFKPFLKKDIWLINLGASYWFQNDKYYRWHNVAFTPSVEARFQISQTKHLSVLLGPAFNVVLANTRKTTEEVGWPYHVFPNLKLHFSI